MRLLFCAVAIGSVLLLFACARRNIPAPTAIPAFATPLPPLPGDKLYRKGAVSNLEIVSATRPLRVVVSWENPMAAGAANYETGVEATVDFRNWQEVARVPYSTSGSIELTNRPPWEFYRVFNTLAQ